MQTDLKIFLNVKCSAWKNGKRSNAGTERLLADF